MYNSKQILIEFKSYNYLKTQNLESDQKQHIKNKVSNSLYFLVVLWQSGL